MLTNPYHNTLPLDSRDMFFGRRAELRRIYSALANRQCISLTGLRQIGKTSLLQYLMYTTPSEVKEQFHCDLSRYIFIFLDLREYLRKDAQDFFSAINEQLFNHCYGHVQVDINTRGGEDAFSSLLDQIKRQGFHTVLLMDAFDNVVLNEEFDLEFFAFLRAQASMKKVSYVTSSVASLDKICHNDIHDSPFFNIFTTYVLGSLTLEEAEQLISVPSSQAGLPFDRDDVDWILTRSGRHPFLLQRTCYFLFEEKSAYPTSELDWDKVEDEICQQLQPFFEKAWKSLSETQQEQLKERVRFPEKYKQVLPELGESALFRRFVMKEFALQVEEITVKDVEEALDHLEDASFLGKCNLQHLRIVSQQLTKEDTSTAKRGLAVRKMLNQAFEKLRGDGTRNDGAIGWKHYNILFYRYFKYNLKNEQVATRLGYNGTRQYFRDRNKAIETLLRELREMEASSS